MTDFHRLYNLQFCTAGANNVCVQEADHRGGGGMWSWFYDSLYSSINIQQKDIKMFFFSYCWILKPVSMFLKYKFVFWTTF